MKQNGLRWIITLACLACLAAASIPSERGWAAPVPPSTSRAVDPEPTPSVSERISQLMTAWSLARSPEAAAAPAQNAAAPQIIAARDLGFITRLPLLVFDWKPNFEPAGFSTCRYGTTDLSRRQNAWLTTLGVGWHLNFGSTPWGRIDSIEYTPVVKVRQNKDGCTYLDGYTISPPLTDQGLGALVDANPGALWIVGNEPDRGPNVDNPNDPDCSFRVQDDTEPEWYAQGYHDVYHFIKQRDPSAQVAIAGLVQVTPGRLQYLDKVWDTYLEKYRTPLPVDVWNMHIYILPEATPDGRPNGVANVAVGTDPALAIRESGDDPARCPDPQVYCWAEHDDLGIFAEQVIAMRDWMKRHGQQNKPLILSEYSILYPTWLLDEYGNYFTTERVARFMTETLAYLESAADPNLGYPQDEYRLVQQVLWFSINVSRNSAGSSSNLVDDSLTNLTELGRLYKQEIASRPRARSTPPSRSAGRSGRNTTRPSPPRSGFPTEIASRPRAANLLPDPIAPVVAVAGGGGQATANLAVEVRNNGNVEAQPPYTVTFYADSALQQPIGSAQVTTSLAGCARRTTRVVVPWEGLSPGKHQFWVKVDATNAIVEGREDDNVASGVAFVAPHQVLLPLTARQ